MLRFTTAAACAVCVAAPAFAQPPHVAKADADGVQRVQVVGGSYFFKPNHIVVKVNAPVELSASRERGLAPHNLVLKAMEAGLAVEEELSTDIKKIVFKPTAVGRYAFYCSKKPPFVAGHRQRGMEGVVEVVP